MGVTSSPCPQEAYNLVGEDKPFFFIVSPLPLPTSTLFSLTQSIAFSPWVLPAGQIPWWQMLGCLSKIPLKTGHLHAESSNVSPKPDLGEKSLLSVLFWKPLTAGICQPSIPPSISLPRPRSVTTFWKARRKQGRERNQSSFCPLTRDGGQVWPKDKCSCMLQACAFEEGNFLPRTHHQSTSSWYPTQWRSYSPR